MSQQQQFGGASRDRDDDVAAPVASTPSVLASGVDDLLDEIDSLLEENAESFVKSFVQKGGQ
jgi:ubiquitin-like protein Pup